MKTYKNITVCAFIICLSLNIITCEVTFTTVELKQCSDYKMEYIMKAVASLDNTCRSLTECGMMCSVSIRPECQYAIYLNSTTENNITISTPHCKLISPKTTQFTDNLPDYIHDPGCIVLQRDADIINNNTMSCQNNGQPLNFTCDCSDTEFTGRYCEIPNPEHCRDGNMRLANGSEHQMLSVSRIPVKLIFDTLIVSARTLDVDSGGLDYYVMAHSFLDLSLVPAGYTSGFFTQPFQWKFLLHSLTGFRSHTATIDMSGNTAFLSSMTSPNVDAYIPDTLDKTRLVFGDGSTGTISELINELASGYRKHEREFTQVSFDAGMNEVFFENVESRLKTINTGSDLNWDTPVSYIAFKKSVNNYNANFLECAVGIPGITTAYTQSMPSYWEMDRCWTRVYPLLDYDELSNVLIEYIENGREIRVIVGDKISSDVEEVQIVGTDIIAHLPGYLNPFDPHGSLSDIYMRSVITRSKMMSFCETQFQGSTVFSKYDILPLDSEIKWYVTSKPWTKIYSIDNNQHVLYGNESYVENVALQGKNIRVCVHEKTDYFFVTCHSSSAIEIPYGTYGVLFQSHASFKIDYHDGVFGGIQDPDCRRYVRLISTQGWIQQAVLVPQSAASHVDHVAFSRIDWFMEG